MFARLTIFQKGLIIISIPLLFQFVLIWAAGSLQLRNDEATRHAQHSREVLGQAEVVLRRMLDSETGMRGYVLIQDQSLLASCAFANAEVPKALARLRELVQNDLQQSASAREISMQASKLLIEHQATCRQVDQGQKREAAMRISAGKQQMDHFRDAIEELAGQEKTRREQHDQDLKEAQNLLSLFMVGGFCFSLLLTAGLGVVFHREVARRMAILIATTQRLREGKDLPPALEGIDEIAQVDRAFRESACELAQTLQNLREVTTQLQRLNEELEQRVRARTAELAEVNRDLAQKNQENELFVYSVSHDLRSPLVNLQGFSKELVQVARELRSLLSGDDLPAKVRDRGTVLIDHDIAECIRFIQTAVLRLSNIIDALLRLSRAGRVVHQAQLVDVQSLIQYIVDSLRISMTERSATILMKKDLPAVWGDRTSLEQVFANLIGNALNYLDPKRPGIVEVGCLPSNSDPTAEGQRTYYVKDNGLGIADAHKAKVFQAFQRLHASVAPGEGMGLAIVQRIVQRHGGKVWVESKVGVGSTFFVSLPINGKNIPFAASNALILLPPHKNGKK